MRPFQHSHSNFNQNRYALWMEWNRTAEIYWFCIVCHAMHCFYLFSVACSVSSPYQLNWYLKTLKFSFRGHQRQFQNQKDTKKINCHFSMYVCKRKTNIYASSIVEKNNAQQYIRFLFYSFDDKSISDFLHVMCFCFAIQEIHASCEF